MKRLRKTILNDTACRLQTLPMVRSWSSLLVGYEGCIGPSRKLLCLCQTPKIVQNMHGIITYMLDCWANPVVHLILLKSSVVRLNKKESSVRLRSIIRECSATIFPIFGNIKTSFNANRSYYWVLLLLCSILYT